MIPNCLRAEVDSPTRAERSKLSRLDLTQLAAAKRRIPARNLSGDRDSSENETGEAVSDPPRFFDEARSESTRALVEASTNGFRRRRPPSSPIGVLGPRLHRLVSCRIVFALYLLNFALLFGKLHILPGNCVFFTKRSLVFKIIRLGFTYITRLFFAKRH